jgi:hypothetical protein
MKRSVMVEFIEVTDLNMQQLLKILFLDGPITPGLGAK